MGLHEQHLAEAPQFSETQVQEALRIAQGDSSLAAEVLHQWQRCPPPSQYESPNRVEVPNRADGETVRLSPRSRSQQVSRRGQPTQRNGSENRVHRKSDGGTRRPAGMVATMTKWWSAVEGGEKLEGPTAAFEDVRQWMMKAGSEKFENLARAADDVKEALLGGAPMSGPDGFEEFYGYSNAEAKSTPVVDSAVGASSSDEQEEAQEEKGRPSRPSFFLPDKDGPLGDGEFLEDFFQAPPRMSRAVTPSGAGLLAVAAEGGKKVWGVLRQMSAQFPGDEGGGGLDPVDLFGSGSDFVRQPSAEASRARRASRSSCSNRASSWSSPQEDDSNRRMKEVTALLSKGWVPAENVRKLKQELEMLRESQGNRVVPGSGSNQSSTRAISCGTPRQLATDFSSVASSPDRPPQHPIAAHSPAVPATGLSHAEGTPAVPGATGMIGSPEGLAASLTENTPYSPRTPAVAASSFAATSATTTPGAEGLAAAGSVAPSPSAPATPAFAATGSPTTTATPAASPAPVSQGDASPLAPPSKAPGKGSGKGKGPGKGSSKAPGKAPPPSPAAKSSPGETPPPAASSGSPPPPATPAGPGGKAGPSKGAGKGPPNKAAPPGKASAQSKAAMASKPKAKAPFGRKFDWQCLPQEKVAGTVFAGLQGDVAVDVSRLRALFEKPKASQATEQKEVSQKPKAVELLSAKRAQNIMIALRRQPLTQQVLAALQRLDVETDALTPEACEVLVGAVPTMEETKLLLGHRHEPEKLREAERLVLPLARLDKPAAGQRLRIVLFGRTMDQLGGDLHAQFGELRLGFDDACKSTAFRTILRHIARLGNAINYGATKAEEDVAAGFSLEALPRLMLFKAASDQRITLLHVLVSQVVDSDPALPDMLQEELIAVRAAVKKQITQLAEDVGAYRREASHVTAGAEQFKAATATAGVAEDSGGDDDRIFAERLNTLATKAVSEASTLEDELAQVRAAARAALTYFAVAAKPQETDTKATELLTLIDSFLESFSRCCKELATNKALAALCQRGGGSAKEPQKAAATSSTAGNSVQPSQEKDAASSAGKMAPQIDPEQPPTECHPATAILQVPVPPTTPRPPGARARKLSPPRVGLSAAA